MQKNPAHAHATDENHLRRLTEICLPLEAAVVERQGDHAAFIVSGKKFAYYLNNHHGDGIVALACRVVPGDNHLLVTSQPHRFYLPAYLASRGWVALRLDRGEIDWEEVRELLYDSYRRIAPKRLAAKIVLE